MYVVKKATKGYKILVGKFLESSDLEDPEEDGCIIFGWIV
jgi:hypothetical protein